MQAKYKVQPSIKQESVGFTIVELLVVIVVIAVLAAITIVTFNGIQERARASLLSSDLSDIAKQFKLAQVTDGAFPTTLEDSPSGIAYQISVDNDASPQTFCITGTKDTTSYSITQDGTATEGGCSGHGQGGVAAITNLAPNPSVENGATLPNGPYYSPTVSVDNSTAVSGNSSVKVTTAGTTYPEGYIWRSAVPSPGTYTCSVSIKGTPGVVVQVGNRAEDTGGGYLTEGQIQKDVTLSSDWQRVFITYNATQPNIGYVSIQYKVKTPAIGVEIWGDAAICTSGTTVYDYADGDSQGWIWNGTPHDSSSTGPA